MLTLETEKRITPFTTVLLIVVCLQLLIILVLFQNSSFKIGNNNGFETECDLKEHSIAKRQIGREWQGSTCPPGCVKRKRRKGSVGVSGGTETINTAERNWGWSGYPGLPGGSGYPGGSGRPGQAGLPGEQGPPGLQGFPGEPGSYGIRGSSGAQGPPGLPGYSGYTGEPGSYGGRGSPGAPGSPGQPGAPGQRGQSGSPGGRGEPGAMGHPGAVGQSGMPGSRGASGAQGPPGERGQPGYHHGYNNYELRSGVSRGDQGHPNEDQYPRTRPNATEILREFRLYSHPQCKDEVDHRALMDTLKDKGKVSFMILIDLQGSEYCIVHS